MKRNSNSPSNGTVPSRRKFIAHAGAAVAGGVIGLQRLMDSGAQAQDPGKIRASRPVPNDEPEYHHQKQKNKRTALTGIYRANYAFKLRINAARVERKVPIPRHPSNGDEQKYPNRIGNFSKGLKHDSLGQVLPDAYDAYLSACLSGEFCDFEKLRPYLGCPDPARQRPFVNPAAAYAYDLEGTDPGQLYLPPAPAFASSEEASEMAELCWMALLRDVPFDAYANSPLAIQAAEDLSKFSNFRGPKVNGRVTPQTLFRDPYPGCTTGPYISQFLLWSTDLGALQLDQRIEPRASGSDYLTKFAAWLDVQNGCMPLNPIVPPENPGFLRYITTGRDITHYVHLDVLYQAYFVAMLILINGITFNESTSPFVFRFPFDKGNPYGPDGATFVQEGFGTFGTPHIATLVAEPATRALKAVWYQKWSVHRRLRPEAFGGCVEVNRQGRADYPVNEELYQSSVLPKLYKRYGAYLLPQAFPEGSPLHPSYGTGHGTVAGACVTMLKAFFDESAVMEGAVQSNPADGGQTTTPYKGPPLTVGGELNKLASNIATARNIAGVHWRSDGRESLMLGETLAISILKDMRETYAEPFEGFCLTKFDGTKIIV